MKVHWSRPALRDLEALLDHISAEDPAAAARVADRIFGQADRLERFPEAGRMGRIGGTKEAVVTATPYILAYRIGSYWR
jgi:plasmid stabilization system protein ParE